MISANEESPKDCRVRWERAGKLVRKARMAGWSGHDRRSRRGGAASKSSKTAGCGGATTTSLRTVDACHESQVLVLAA